MPHGTPIKPTHKAIQAYYAALQTYKEYEVRNEGALETAFQRLLADTGRTHGWTLLPKQPFKKGSKTIVPDGTLQDDYHLPRGFWEAKDPDDDLDTEIRKKTKAGYPLTNIIFEDTRRAVLYQNGIDKLRADLTDRRVSRAACPPMRAALAQMRTFNPWRRRSASPRRLAMGRNSHGWDVMPRHHWRQAARVSRRWLQSRSHHWPYRPVKGDRPR